MQKEKSEYGTKVIRSVIPPIVSIIIAIVAIVGTRTYFPPIIIFVLIGFLFMLAVGVVWPFSIHPLINFCKKKFRAFKLHLKVPELVKDFEDIRAKFDDKFAYQSNGIFHISSYLVDDEKFSDIFGIFKRLRGVFSNRTYPDFKTEYDSFSERKIKKKEDFVSILRDFIAVLQAHGCIIESILALVENKRYKRASEDTVKEFTTFKERYNSYLEDWADFIKRVNRNLEEDLHSEFERIKDEDVSKLVKLSKKEEK